jgi:hypothetical protein
MTITLSATYCREETCFDDKPECRALVEMWEHRRGARIAPPWRGFDWHGVPNDVIPFCGVVDVVEGPPLDFVYRFWGTAHQRAHAQELTGKSVREMRPMAESESVFAQYRETLEAAQPLFFVNTLEVGPLGSIYEELSLRLPFSDDGINIDKIFAFSDLRTGYRALVRELNGEC